MSARKLATFFVMLLLFPPLEASALSLTLGNLVLVPPANPVNEAELTISTDVAGSDSDTVTLAGNITAELDFQFVGGTVIPTGLTLTGGAIAFSDTNFSFLAGFVQVQASGLTGTPFTSLPPGTVTGTTFPASEHALLIDQGTVSAAGNVFDFSLEPTVFNGMGTGAINVTTMPGPGPLPSYLVNTTLELPIDINETYVIENVPIVTTVTATLTGSAVAVANEQLILTLLLGDYNQDLSLDCADTELLAGAVASGSTDLTFDVNEDGVVDAQDIPAWATDLKMTLPGDANLDFTVDGTDFLIWNANKFDSGTHWCNGDFNGDGITDGSDFIVWNTHKFTTTDVAPVPEPASVGLFGMFLCWLFFGEKRAKKTTLTFVHYRG